MRVFITGATGFIGTALTKDLIAAGHQVRGLARSDASAQQLQAMGAEAYRGTLQDLDSLRCGATGMDAVVNLAFNHDDMTKFAESGKDERAAIEVLGAALAPGKLLVVTSGAGLASGGPGHVRLESDAPMTSAAIRSTSSMSCEEISTDHLPSLTAANTPRTRSSRTAGSSPLNGSSSNISTGLRASALASATRCC